jgi:3-phenylpropionate/trans-cinnamate dioxygenase ferredoxin reductase subunit
MLGGALPASDPAPHTFSAQHGHDLSLFGRPESAQRVVLRGEPAAVLVGGLAVDAPRDVGVLRRLLGAPRHPVIDLQAATDPRRSLREAVRG